MGADVRALAAGGVLVLVLGALVAATSDGAGWLDIGPLAEEDGANQDQGEREAGTGSGDAGGAGAADDPSEGPVSSTTRDAPGWLLVGSVALLALAVGCFLVAVAASFRLVVRRRRLAVGRSAHGGPARHTQTEPLAPEPALEDALVGELVALGEGSPRNAVVAAWVRLEEIATARGLSRAPSDSPAEFVARALAAYPLDTTALQRLAELYREARFSEHPLTESHRAEARACLERLVTGVLAR